MATFIEQAKEVLNTEQFDRLERLARKSAEFDTNSDEDKEFFDLKQEVKQLIATRDRQKNLSFLKDAKYDIKDIFEVMGTSHQKVIKESGLSIADIIKSLEVTKKQVTQAMNEAFPKGQVVNNGYQGVLATYGSEDVKVKGNSRELKKLVVDSGAKKFVENLTDSAKAWMIESYLSEKGPYKGQMIFQHLNNVAQVFNFNKDELKKELGLIKEEVKVAVVEDKNVHKKHDGKKVA